MSKKLKHPIKVIMLRGNNGTSFLYEGNHDEAGVRTSIDRYMAIFVSEDSEKDIICATQDTCETFYIMIPHKKNTIIMKYNDEEYFIGKKKISECAMPFKGIFGLIWKLEYMDNEYSFTWVDSQSETAKTININSFGYEAEDLITIISRIILCLSKQFSQSAGKKFQEKILSLKGDNIFLDKVTENNTSVYEEER